MNDETEKKVELEKLNSLLDAAVGALAEATGGDLPPGEAKVRLGRVRRLGAEMDAVLEALEVDLEPEPVMVRVAGENGGQEQHEVVFPIYARGNKPGEVRKIDSEMMETSFYSEINLPFAEVYRVARRRVDFLDGQGADYWLGRGYYALDEASFDYEAGGVVSDIMQLAGVNEEEED